MKRSMLIVILVLLTFFVRNVSAGCNLNAALINQDPYPAIPGEYVKVVFQLTGIEDPECGNIGFSLKEGFPFSLDPESRGYTTLKGGTYAGREFSSYLIVPYKVRVDENALEGNNTLVVDYYTGGNNSGVKVIKDFDINVKNVRTDFEINVKDYDYVTNTITFGILNTGENDAEALAVDIPKQENIDIKGGSRSIIGSLNSKDDTTFSFEGTPRNGEIKLNVLYTDAVNKRREIEKTVIFDSSYFEGRVKDIVAPKPTSYYIAIALVAFIVASWIYRWYRKRKKRMRDLHARK